MWHDPFADSKKSPLSIHSLNHSLLPQIIFDSLQFLLIFSKCPMTVQIFLQISHLNFFFISVFCLHNSKKKWFLSTFFQTNVEDAFRLSSNRFTDTHFFKIAIMKHKSSHRKTHYIKLNLAFEYGIESDIFRYSSMILAQKQLNHFMYIVYWLLRLCWFNELKI